MKMLTLTSDLITKEQNLKTNILKKLLSLLLGDIYEIHFNKIFDILIQES